MLNDSRLAGYVGEVRNAVLVDEPHGEMLHGLCKVVLTSAMGITGAQEGAALVVDKELGCLRIEVWEGPGVEAESRVIGIDPEKSICGWTVVYAQPKLVSNVPLHKQNNVIPRFLSKSRSVVLSELAVPVKSRGIVIGVVNLESSEVNHFTTRHIEDITSFCEAVGHYWELASLLDWRARMLQQQTELSKINEKLVNGSITLNAIVNSVRHLLKATIADILLLDAEGDNLIVHAVGNILEGDRGRKIKRGQGVVWRCMDEAQIQIVPDTTKDRQYIKDFTTHEMKSMLAAPLIYRNEAIGVIDVEGEKLNQFTLEDAQILKLFAEQATMAVVSSKVFEQKKAGQALASLGSVTGNLAHRMNNIVGGIRVLASFLANDLSKSLPDLAGRARQIETTAKEALDVVEQYETMFRESDEKVDLTQLIIQISKQAHPANVQILTHVPKTPLSLKTSRQLLSELIHELIRNAIKSIGDSGIIEIAAKETRYAVTLTVSDTGKGLSEETRAHIFERGYKNRGTGSGMGFGLWWVDNFVTSLGGKIVVRSGEKGGAEFQVIFSKSELFNR